MRHSMIITVKLIMKYIFSGISLGCTFFVIMCLSLFVTGNEDILMTVFQDFARQSAGAMLVGIAGGGTAVIYQFRTPSPSVKRIIHFCAGVGVYFPVALYLGWMPFYKDRFMLTVLELLLTCGIFMIIWLCFYLFNRSEAKRINERLKEMAEEKPKEKSDRINPKTDHLW